MFSCFEFFSQDSYLEDFFLSKCNVCNSLESKGEVIKEEVYAWHQAHLSFSEKDYEKVNYFLLKDSYTDKALKNILQAHLLFRLKLFSKAEEKIRTIRDENYHLIRKKSLGLFFERRDYDSAVFYYKKILSTKKIPNKLENEVNESLAYLNLSKKEFKKAEDSYFFLLKTYKRAKDLKSLARVYSNLGNLCFEQYRDLEAKQYFDSAYVAVSSLNEIKLRKDILYNLYIVSEALKEHKQAIKYLKEYNVLKDSIHVENTVWKIAEQKEAFNIAAKQVEIDQKTRQRNIFIVFFTVVLFLLVIIFWFYKKLRQKHQQIGVLNKELEESNELKNQIFSIVAHDLRSPVALLKQKFQLQKVNEEDETITIDKNVVSVIDSLSFLLDNLLNWSLSQSNLLHVQKDWFPLLPVVKQIEHQYKSLLQEKSIDFKVENLSSILIFGDMELFKIIVRNCLDNAIKFTPVGGEITIFGVAKSEFFKLSIQDSGIGIPEVVLKTLFELNAEKAQKDTQGRKSSGLGLHLVKSMIELNNGTIQIQNNPRGGTIVNISVSYKYIA